MKNLLIAFGLFLLLVLLFVSLLEFANAQTGGWAQYTPSPQTRDPYYAGTPTFEPPPTAIRGGCGINAPLNGRMIQWLGVNEQGQYAPLRLNAQGYVYVDCSNAPAQYRAAPNGWTENGIGYLCAPLALKDKGLQGYLFYQDAIVGGQ